MGGTFDPVHYGHLVTAGEARWQFKLDLVLFVPNRHPPHKDPDEVSSPEHRYLMTFLAIATNPRFRVSRMEIDRPGPSYTIDTIRTLRREEPTAYPPQAVQVYAHRAKPQCAENGVLGEVRRLADQEVDPAEGQWVDLAKGPGQHRAQHLAGVFRGKSIAGSEQHHGHPGHGRHPIPQDVS